MIWKGVDCIINTATRFFHKPYRWAAVWSLALAAAFAFVLLDTFVVPKTLGGVITAPDGGIAGDIEREAAPPEITDSTYHDDNISIMIEKQRVSETNVFIADIMLSDVSLLKTAFANDTYGRNINAATSVTAASHGAILAINGDTYGFRDYGVVARNGTLYRGGFGNSGQALVMDSSGKMYSAPESKLTTVEMESSWQIWSFGPPLVTGGLLSVDENSEISGRVSVSNPRTAIGMIEPLHYIFIVSEGRTADNKGLSLYELAQVFFEYGCTEAYNLDGGGSSAMVFNGDLVNRPTDGRKYTERAVSDIVYIGY